MYGSAPPPRSRTHRRSILAGATVAGVLAGGLTLATGGPATAGAASTSRISVSSTGAQVNASTGQAAISADGRYVVFQTEASNLVRGDTNGYPDLFLRDRRTGSVTRISVTNTGRQADGVASFPAISLDGRYVTYTSSAPNLVSGDTNGVGDVFVHDLHTGAVERVSVTSTGAQGNSWSGTSVISGDGRFVAFHSGASNLVAGDTNDIWDVFLHDRRTGRTERVNVSDIGWQVVGYAYGVAISADGRFVGFGSSAPGLVSGDTDQLGDVFVRDVRAGRTERVNEPMTGQILETHSTEVAMSADGRFVVFNSGAANLVPGDTNNVGDVFVRDRVTGRIERVSLTSAGGESNGWSTQVTISPDGRFVGFASDATNLVPGDTNNAGDAFIHDRRTGRTERASVSTAGVEGNGYSSGPQFSAYGRYALFGSHSTNLVPGDTNGHSDLFLRDRAG